MHLLALGLGAVFFAGETTLAGCFGDEQPIFSSQPLDLARGGKDTPRVKFAFLEELRELRHGILKGAGVLARGVQEASPQRAVQEIHEILYGCLMVENGMASRAALERATSVVLSRVPGRPKLGLVLGSGLGPLVNQLEGAISVPYSEIPGMPTTSVAGHSGKLTFGGLGGVATACLEGRVHLYEGREPQEVVFGVRLLAKLGCEIVMLTNAAGGTKPSLAPGSVMLIADHINLTGRNPLVDWTHPARFIDLSNAYDAELRRMALAAAEEVGVRLQEGVYAGLLGPNYETKAEVRYLARIGADAVGMSTVLETIALCEQDVRVIALSCITNAAAGVEGAVLDHAHVQQVARQAAGQMEALILAWARRAVGSSRTDLSI